MLSLADLPRMPHGFKAELAAMVRLALPIVVVQLGWMFMGVVDTVMVGRVSAEAIAAVALGNVYFFGAAIFGVGVLMALDPVVAQAAGAGDAPGIALGVQRGLVLTALLSAIASLLLLPARPVLGLLDQPAPVAEVAAAYARIAIAGILPFYAFGALRQSLQALKRIAPIVITMLVANAANVALNYVWIFGKLGFPALGAIGAAWATAVSRWILFLLLLALGWKTLRPHLLPLRREALAWTPLRRMAAIGAPIGAQMQLEYGIFAAVGVMMGWLGTVELAGHQVALNLASVTFMVPLGVSAAAAVLVGHAVGRGDAAEARRAAAAALVCGVGFMTASAGLMLAVPDQLARLYTTDAAVAAMAASLIPIAGLFQVFDGTQVVSIGILRGVADTRTPMLVNILGFWLVGLPISAALGLGTAAGPRGLWWGLTVGLMLVALVLLARVRRRLAGSVARVVIDASAPAGQRPAPAREPG
ncbi:MAG TPA: MATE family efflux transporter [Gemmatimonadales bacterium]|nr:MATE family efflux transporter [Gemmatimonadales bacterium]